MKDQMLKIAKVKSEKEFYKKYPTEEAFMKAHGKAFKKAAMGKSMVNDQLHQLTDFGNPPIAQFGSAVNPNTGMFNMPMLGKSVSQVDTMAAGFGSVAPPEGFGNTAKGAGGGAAGAAMAGLGAIQGIIGGIEAIGAQKKAKKKAEQNTQLSGLALQAQQGVQDPKRKYVRPEDALVQPGQLGNPYGSGTNFLAENGTRIGGNPTEIQNMYNPGDMYTDLGFEPLGETLKQFKHGGGMHKAELGDYFQDSGQAQIGSAVGGAAAAAFGLPPELGQFAGRALGNVFGGAKQANELKAEQSKAAMNNAQLAFSQSNQFGANLKNGGDVGDEYKWVSHTWQPQTITKFGEYNVKDLLKPPHDADMLRSGGHLKDEYYTPPSAEAMFTGRPELEPLTMEHGGQMAMGGDLEVIEGGKAETISYNPFLPDGGETVMFKGRSHDNGGIPINFGENGVEVEGGEPAVKLQNGGEENNMVVFGAIDINEDIANLMKDPEAKGKKMKHYVADIAKNDAKQLKIIDKATDIINNANNNSAAGHLELITANLMKKGAEDYQKMNAKKIQEAGIVQNAILDTASELGVKSDELAKGKLIKEKDPRMMAKNGKELKMAQRGRGLSPIDDAGRTMVANMKPGDEMFYGDRTYVTERGQLPLFARMLGAKPKPLTFNEPLTTSLTFGTPYSQASPFMAPSSTAQVESMPVVSAPVSSTNTKGKTTNVGNKSGKTTTSKGLSKASTAYVPPTAVNLTDNRGPNYNWMTDSTPFPRPTGISAMPESVAPLNVTNTSEAFASSPEEKTFAGKALQFLGKGVDKYGPTLLSNLSPFLRPSNANEALPADQLYPEYFAMATNQLEPVQAQTFQPMLDTPMDISLNDQLAAIDAQSRALLRQVGNNPSVLANIAAQTLQAKNQVLGEQTRINTANKMQTYDKNRALLNDAQLRNLQILDQQYVRQAQAKSNTREQTFNALSSIAAKTAQQRAANRKLAVMENMYGFRFTPSGRAINVNAPAQFNTSSFATNSGKGLASGLEYTYDSQGNIIGTRKAPTSGKASMGELDDAFNKNGGKTSKKKARNSSIVKALKNL
jgi:hypothetical protein